MRGVVSQGGDVNIGLLLRGVTEARKLCDSPIPSTKLQSTSVTSYSLIFFPLTSFLHSSKNMRLSYVYEALGVFKDNVLACVNGEAEKA